MQRNYSHQQKKGLAFLARHHREATIALCAFLILLVRFLFPAELAGEWLWLNLFLFLAFPILTIKYILKENLGKFGLTKGNPKIGILMALAGIVAFTAFNYLLISKPDFQNYFHIYTPIAQNFWIFVWFEIIIAGVVFFSREFFFRGFLQLGLEKKLGNYSIFAQSALYSLLFVRQSWFTVLTAFLSAIFAGYIVSKSRSIYYSFAFIWLVSFIMDIMLIRFVVMK